MPNWYVQWVNAAWIRDKIVKVSFIEIICLFFYERYPFYLDQEQANFVEKVVIK